MFYWEFIEGGHMCECSLTIITIVVQNYHVFQKLRLPNSYYAAMVARIAILIRKQDALTEEESTRVVLLPMHPSSTV